MDPQPVDPTDVPRLSSPSRGPEIRRSWLRCPFLVTGHPVTGLDGDLPSLLRGNIFHLCNDPVKLCVACKITAPGRMENFPL